MYEKQTLLGLKNIHILLQYSVYWGHSLKIRFLALLLTSAVCPATMNCVATAATMNYIGAWSSTTAYSAGAVVLYGNQTYYATSAGTNKVPSPTSTYWKLISTNGMDYKGAWSATTTYQIGSVVNFNSQNFYSLQATNLNKAPDTQTAWWVLVGTNGNTVRSGAGLPASTVGVIGDFWIDVTGKVLYGPKAVSGWPVVGATMIGPAGPKGDAGTAGATGPAGPKGDAGAAGATGPAGPKGDAGTAGATGPAGPKGDVGTAGADGAAGPQGPAGVAGPAGSKGDAGAAGADGAAGPQGPAGPKGDAGAAGATGPAGPAGAAGAAGAQGAAGPAGPAGADGAKGDTGPAGTQGASGPQGNVGATGPQGPTGATGPQGQRPTGYSVVDNTGLPIGSLSTNGVLVTIGDDIVEVAALTTGFPQVLGTKPFYYESNDCTGTPYFSVDGAAFVRSAQGVVYYTMSNRGYATVWYPSGAATSKLTKTYKSYDFNNRVFYGSCQWDNYPSGSTRTVAPVANVDLSYSTPFKVQ